MELRNLEDSIGKAHYNKVLMAAFDRENSFATTILSSCI